MDSDFFGAFVKSLSVVAASEVGDKTFFIAAVLAMKHPRWLVSLVSTRTQICAALAIQIRRVLPVVCHQKQAHVI